MPNNWPAWGQMSGIPPEPFEEGAYIRVDFDIVLCPEPGKMAKQAREFLHLSHGQATEMAQAARDHKPWVCGPYPMSTASGYAQALRGLGLKAYMTDVPLERSERV